MYLKKISTAVTAVCFLGILLVACDESKDYVTDDDTNTTTEVTMDTVTTSPTPQDTATVIVPTDTAAGTASNNPGATVKPAKKYRATLEVIPTVKRPKYNKDAAGVYDYSEVMPMYPGGQTALEDYINSRINYPQAAIDDSKEGRVQVKFVVDENGKISNATQTGAMLGSGLDQEAVRVVSNLPKFNPGTINGKAVKVNMTLPIVFKIEE